MRFDEIDEETEVSQGEAITELEAHHKNVQVLGTGELYDIDEEDIIAEPDDLLTLQNLRRRRHENHARKENAVKRRQKGHREARSECGRIATHAIEHNNQTDQGADHAKGRERGRHGLEDINLDGIATERGLDGIGQNFPDLVAGVATDHHLDAESHELVAL